MFVQWVRRGNAVSSDARGTPGIHVCTPVHRDPSTTISYHNVQCAAHMNAKETRDQDTESREPQTNHIDGFHNARKAVIIPM